MIRNGDVNKQFKAHKHMLKKHRSATAVANVTRKSARRKSSRVDRGAGSGGGTFIKKRGGF